MHSYMVIRLHKFEKKVIFRHNASIAFWPYVTLVSFAHHKVRQSYILRTVWPRITRFYTDMHTDLIDICTRYDATSCFRWLQVEFLENGLCEYQQILHAYRGQSAPQTCWIWCHQLLPVGCKTQLNTAQKCVKWVRADQECNNSATV